jgi:EmrB/QacA subfamily drug resistance transporter
MPGTNDARRWLVLAVVGAAFFMTILDVAIVNVALPSMGRDLEASSTSLQWVLTAYSLTFGGFLLLGGRAADLLGRRSVFIVGLVVFTVASLVCGIADNLGVLVGARAAQGLGAAIISPAALSIVTTVFAEGADRNKALGIWGALGGSGAAVGVLLGGVITKWLGWEWIFIVNVPVGIAVLVACLLVVKESKLESRERGFDPLGAITSTGSLVALVYAISKAPDVGWDSAQTIILLVAAVVLAALFLAIEKRVAQPIMPLSILKVRTVAAANVVSLLLGASVFATFFILTLYVQQVLGWSALKTGVTFLATAGTTVLWAGLSQALVTKTGPRRVMVVGLTLMGIATVLYTQVPVQGSYAGDLLPGYLIYAAGMAGAFIPVSVAALAGVKQEEAGLASGLFNTNQQIGGALGVAIAATISTSRFESLRDQGKSVAEAATGGYHWAFWVLAGFAFAGALVALALVRDTEVAVGADGKAPSAAL